MSSNSGDSEPTSWNPKCCGIMIQEGDRAGVMRAFGMHWVTASFLAEYKIGFDYTNKVNLLTLLDSDEEQHDQRFFDLDSLQWCRIDYIHGHFGDLHIAQTRDDAD